MEDRGGGKRDGCRQPRLRDDRRWPGDAIEPSPADAHPPYRRPHRAFDPAMSTGARERAARPATPENPPGVLEPGYKLDRWWDVQLWQRVLQEPHGDSHGGRDGDRLEDSPLQDEERQPGAQRDP